MKKKLDIKVCGNAMIDNALMVGSLMPDFMGFIFYSKSSRYVLPELAKDISDNIDSSIKKVGVFVNESSATILRIVDFLTLDFIQLHGHEDLNYVIDLKSKTNAKLIKVFGVDDEFNIKETEQFENYVDYFLFDTATKHYGGSGRKFKWDKLHEYKLQTPFMLSGGINKNDSKEIKSLDLKKLVGVDVNSGFEIEPAVKDIDALSFFINDLRNEK